MTALEVIATIFAILVLVKLSVVLTNPKLWIKKVAEPLLGNYVLATAIYTALGIVIGYFVFTRMNIVEIAAVMAFTGIVGALGILPYAEALMKTADEMAADRSKLLRNAWLPIVIWGVIAIWVLSSVLA